MESGNLRERVLRHVHKIFQVQTKTKGKKQLRNTSKTVDRICQLVAERKEERDFKYDLKALRQNGENTEVQKALEKKWYNFTKKKKRVFAFYVSQHTGYIS